jgi:hypothetical protein
VPSRHHEFLFRNLSKIETAQIREISAIVPLAALKAPCDQVPTATVHQPIADGRLPPRRRVAFDDEYGFEARTGSQSRWKSTGQEAHIYRCVHGAILVAKMHLPEAVAAAVQRRAIQRMAPNFLDRGETLC